MHASGCNTTKQIRFHAGMQNLQSETVEHESSTNKDGQNGGYKLNKYVMCAQNTED